jgi:transcription initiation factor IIF auxiliary subunit
MVDSIIKAEAALAPEETIKEIDTLCRKHIKSKTLTDESFSYMARLINEDSPKNATELYGLITDFLTDGMQYTDDEAFKLCDLIQKILLERKLITIE